MSEADLGFDRRHLSRRLSRRQPVAGGRGRRAADRHPRRRADRRRLAALEARWRGVGRRRCATSSGWQVRDAGEPAGAARRRGGRTLAAFAGGAPVQTDDRTALEFSAPLTLYARTGLALVDRLRALRRAIARSRAAVAAALGIDRRRIVATPRGDVPRRRSLRRRRSTPPRGRSRSIPASPSADVLVKAAVPLGRVDAAEALLEQSRRRRAGRGRGRGSRCRGCARRAAMLEGAHAHRGRGRRRASRVGSTAWEQLASVLGDVGDADRLATAVRETDAARAGRAGPRATTRRPSRFLRGDFAEAAALGERAAALRQARRPRLEPGRARRARASATSRARVAPSTTRSAAIRAIRPATSTSPASSSTPATPHAPPRSSARRSSSTPRRPLRALASTPHVGADLAPSRRRLDPRVGAAGHRRRLRPALAAAERALRQVTTMSIT